MKRAIVLGGGGSRGSYELGAWEALREMNIDYQMAVGTSIGSINAALMAQGDFELAENLWSNITVDQVMADGINLYPDMESFFNQKNDLAPFFKRYAANRGADISPLVQITKESVDEARVRASSVEMGLVTVRFPAFSPVELMLSDMPQGTLNDYLMASAACYPAFPVHRIGEEGFVDGGYYDNLPINLALSRGAEEVVCIDLVHKPTHPNFLSRPYVTYIYASQPLGPILLFEKAVLDRNRRMGYLDTLRAFSKVLGTHYAFDPQDALRYADKARRFTLEIARFEASLAFKSAFTRSVTGSPLSDALKRQRGAAPAPCAVSDLLAASEICAAKLGVEAVERYTISALHDAILQKLPLSEADALVESLQKSDTMGLIGLLTKMSRALLITCLWRMLENGLAVSLFTRLLIMFPEELIAAFYLREMAH